MWSNTWRGNSCDFFSRIKKKYESLDWLYTQSTKVDKNKSASQCIAIKLQYQGHRKTLDVTTEEKADFL